MILLRHLVVSVSCLLAVASGPGHAAEIDCKAARSTVERAICAEPGLRAQDAALDRAFAASRASGQPAPEVLAREQRAWLKQRDETCGKPMAAAARRACLSDAYAARLAALAPPAPPTPVAAAPAPAVPAPSAPAVVAIVAPPVVAPVVGAGFQVAAGAAVLAQPVLSAEARTETLLLVTAAGRFALTATSASGTALQLADMLTGPSEIAGTAGVADGRLDLLLDEGVYKLRAIPAPGATGEVTLAAAAFQEAGPARALPAQERIEDMLADRQQLSFWFTLEPGEALRVQAAGRSLAELVLWRNGTDIVPLEPSLRVIEPVRGQPMTDIVLSGVPGPGLYRLTAYAGRPLAWADGSAAQPFHLRRGASPGLRAGWVAAAIGPFGSEVFEIGGHAQALRLDLAEAGEMRLAVPGGPTTAIARNARVPMARLAVPAGDAARVVELAGRPGQVFQLRATPSGSARSLARPGSYWVAAEAQGMGGDEVPASVLLARRTGSGPTLATSAVAPRVGPGLAWRQRFNLRAQVSLLVQVAGAGPIALRSSGVAVQAELVPLGGNPVPASGGAAWEVVAGWYRLTLTPMREAAGIIDVTLGPPGLQPEAVDPVQPADPTLPFGLVELEANEQVSVLSGGPGGGYAGLVARPVPVDLASLPLAVMQAAGQVLEVPVRLPGDGVLVALEVGAGAVAAEFLPAPGPAAGRIGVVRLAAAARARGIVLSWRRPDVAVPPLPAPLAAAPLPLLQAGVPAYLDLPRGGGREFALMVPEGGLYRVETLGRQRTTGQIGTAFLPALDSAAANGAGQNMLMQRFLRAGRYRVAVATQESAGRLGVVARTAALREGATLVPGGSVRAALEGDAGVVFPIEIGAAGRYRLELLSLAQGLVARLEDEQGWPLVPAGDLAGLDQELAPGRYRLLVQPVGIAARVVARLAPVVAAPVAEGHGPFDLPFGSRRTATWREPAGRDLPRTPDAWSFALAGPAAVMLTISDGMVAQVVAAEGGAARGRFTLSSPFQATLPAGAYRVDATSLGRNDRLDYSIGLDSPALQPGRPRLVTLPTRQEFALAEDRVVSLTSFGRTPLRGVLRRGDGTVVERFGDRGDDWNIGVSRRLAAGSYTLDLARATPPRGVRVRPGDAASGLPAEESEEGEEDGEGAAPREDSEMAEGREAEEARQAEESGEAAEDGGEGPGWMRPGKVELRLALPADRAVAQPPAGDGILALAGEGVHLLGLPATAPGGLTVVAASAATELVLALERQDAAGRWHGVSVAQGRAPVLAAVAGAGWRVAVWPVDGGDPAIRLAVRSLAAPAVAPGVLAPEKLVLDGMPQALAAVRLALPGRGPVRLEGDVAASAVWVGGEADAVLEPVEGGLVVPQVEQAWLLLRDAPARIVLSPLVVAPGAALALALPEGGSAMLPAAPLPAGTIRLALAQSGLGQPGLAAGRGMAVVPGGALALVDGPARVFAAGGGALRLRATLLDLGLLPERVLVAGLAEMLPPRSALPVRLPPGVVRLELGLAAGMAAIADWRGAGAVTAWAGTGAASRTVEGTAQEVLLVNPGDVAAPVRLDWELGDAALALRPGAVAKRFFGAAGTLDVAVTGPGRLMVAGGEATLVGAAGQVLRGRALPVAGPGRVVVTHPPGLLAVWMEAEGVSPWPSLPPQPVALSGEGGQTGRVTLTGPAMALRLAPAGPVVLRASSTAPLILVLGDAPPVLFAAGVELHRALPEGPVTLLLVSPHDGDLAGTLRLRTEPVLPAGEGIGPTSVLAPGASAVFGFELARAGLVGVGVRAEPDGVAVRLLEAGGRELGVGVAQLHRLPPGRYLLEALVPADGVATLLRPALVGIVPRPNRPPQSIINTYLELAGRAPAPAAAAGAAP